MLRNNKVVLVSHCVLNQNSVVRPLAREEGGFSQIMSIVAEYPVGVIQLPCPETLFLGMDRPPMSKEEYDTSEYRELCGKLVENQSDYLEALRKGGCTLVGIIGIEESPTCSYSGEGGVFAEELRSQTPFSDLPVIDVPANYHEDSDIDESFHERLRRWLEEVSE